MPYRLRHMRKRERKLILWYCRWVFLRRYVPVVFLLKFGIRAGVGVLALDLAIPSAPLTLIAGGALCFALLTQGSYPRFSDNSG